MQSAEKFFSSNHAKSVFAITLLSAALACSVNVPDVDDGTFYCRGPGDCLSGYSCVNSQCLKNGGGQPCQSNSGCNSIPLAFCEQGVCIDPCAAGRCGDQGCRIDLANANHYQCGDCQSLVCQAGNTCVVSTSGRICRPSCDSLYSGCNAKEGAGLCNEVPGFPQPNGAQGTVLACRECPAGSGISDCLPNLSAVNFENATFADDHLGCKNRPCLAGEECVEQSFGSPGSGRGYCRKGCSAASEGFACPNSSDRCVEVRGYRNNTATTVLACGGCDAGCAGGSLSCDCFSTGTAAVGSCAIPPGSGNLFFENAFVCRNTNFPDCVNQAACTPGTYADVCEPASKHCINPCGGEQCGSDECRVTAGQVAPDCRDCILNGCINATEACVVPGPGLLPVCMRRCDGSSSCSDQQLACVQVQGYPNPGTKGVVSVCQSCATTCTGAASCRLTQQLTNRYLISTPVNCQ